MLVGNLGQVVKEIGIYLVQLSEKEPVVIKLVEGDQCKSTQKVWPSLG